MSSEVVTEQKPELMYQSIEKLAEILLPDRVSFSDIKDHVRGYKKRKAVEEIVERAREDPFITRVKLHLVYCELHRLFNNGGL